MKDLTFIETQFPVSKISKEAYKERMANYSQTLTGLGKWWGRKPLILVRAAILGLLMPASDDPEKDREIFLKILTMDPEGLWRRKENADKNIAAKDIFRILTDENHEDRIRKKMENFSDILQGIVSTTHDSRVEFLMNYLVKDGESIKWKKKIEPKEKEALEKLAFEALYYDEKLNYCDRPEQIEGPDQKTWKEINSHLKTKAKNLSELTEELGKRRFGHRPKVGDAFCGGGSIPFEAARMGCDVYASDLNPVAALLTWAGIHIVGGGPAVAEEVKRAQTEIYDAVDKQITEWGIEHNEEGHRADAYLYCVEVEDPETGWLVPLAPSWIIGERTKTVAILKPDKKNKRYNIEIKMDASVKEMKEAKNGTVQGGYVVHPMNPNRVAMGLIRRENKEGLRLWENEDVVPRKNDVFQERLYCIRYVDMYYLRKIGDDWERVEKEEMEKDPNFESLLGKGLVKEASQRYYTAPSDEDLKREKKVLRLLKERFSEWQEKGYIPSRKIEKGYNTDQPIRERGWTHWHHLFNPRQLLVLGTSLSKALNDEKFENRIFLLLSVGRLTDWSTKLCRFGTGAARESIAQTFYNQALNTLFVYAVKGFDLLSGNWETNYEGFFKVNSLDNVKVSEVNKIVDTADCWITDPPYADAINYHELSEFFLAWYEKHLQVLFPDWYTDSKRALAITGQDEDFRRTMVSAYKNLADHMPENGLQIVMFTHQDVGVWADLALILWASGLRVTSAWTIATEVSVGIREGNYVQGTVLLVLRKNLSNDTAFLDELNPQIEEEVKNQVDSMRNIEDKEEPNFGDTDYQLAAYAAALRVLTSYKKLGDIDVERELSRVKKKGEKSALEDMIENAKGVATSYLIPAGIEKNLWNDMSGMERFYLKSLDMESRGENKTGTYNDLAKGFGLHEYSEIMASLKANEARPRTASEFKDKMLGEDEFGAGSVRHALYSIYSALQAGSPAQGRDYLKAEFKDYRKKRLQVVSILRYLERFSHTLSHWKKDGDMAGKVAALVDNDGG